MIHVMSVVSARCRLQCENFLETEARIELDL